MPKNEAEVQVMLENLPLLAKLVESGLGAWGPSPEQFRAEIAALIQKTELTEELRAAHEATVVLQDRIADLEWRMGMPTEADKSKGSDDFLVCFESSECEVVVQSLNLYRGGFYDDGDDHIPEGSVIAWMPLPKPPERRLHRLNATDVRPGMKTCRQCRWWDRDYAEVLPPFEGLRGACQYPVPDSVLEMRETRDDHDAETCPGFVARVGGVHCRQVQEIDHRGRTPGESKT